MPLALRLTFSTSSACRSTDIFLWIMPSPPSWARAIAISLSVTVSIGELNRGIFSRIRCVSRVETSHLGRHDFAIPRLQQHVVERKSLMLAYFLVHGGAFRGGRR